MGYLDDLKTNYDNQSQQRRKIAQQQGIFSGLDRASKALTNIRLERTRLDRETQDFNIKKKKSELEIQEAELKYGPDAVAAVRETQKLNLAAATAARKAAERNAANMEQQAAEAYKTEEQKLKDNLRFLQENKEQLQEAEEIYGLVPEIGKDGKFTLKSKTKGGLTEHQNKIMEFEKQRAVNAIKTGKVFDKRGGIDSTLDLETPDAVMAYISSLNVDQNDSEIKSALAEKFPDMFGGDRGSAEGKVRMKAPDGTIAMVPKEKVEAYKKKGASLVE